jgi:hypothetical protein
VTPSNIALNMPEANAKNTIRYITAAMKTSLDFLGDIE